MKNIKFSKNSISVKDIENVKSVINSGWLTHGKFTNLFEKEFSKYKNVFYSKDIKTAISDSDLIIIHTEWNDFKSINFKLIMKNKKCIIFDMRNIYSPSKMNQLNIKYFSIGK